MDLSSCPFNRSLHRPTTRSPACSRTHSRTHIDKIVYSTKLLLYPQRFGYYFPTLIHPLTPVYPCSSTVFTLWPVVEHVSIFFEWNLLYCIHRIGIGNKYEIDLKLRLTDRELKCQNRERERERKKIDMESAIEYNMKWLNRCQTKNGEFIQRWISDTQQFAYQYTYNYIWQAHGSYLIYQFNISKFLSFSRER